MMDTWSRPGTVTAVLLLCISSLDAKYVKHGHWGPWGPMSLCSVSCGSGIVFKERVWVQGPNEAPLKVPFTSTQMFQCTDMTYPECPKNGCWSVWGLWSVCTEMCGGGKRVRNRECLGQTPGGKPCDGDKFSEEDCNIEPCPAVPHNFNISQCNDDSNYTCTSKKMCIPLYQECDGTIQCNDGSDEQGCQDNRLNWEDEDNFPYSRGRNDACSMLLSWVVALVSQSAIASSILWMRH